ncbi:MAG: nucleoside triphosphate pyrophosphohydrolase [Halioglobus sp.]
MESYTLADLLRIMQRLRDPESGCPWDIEQDFQSILPSTLEECYELAEAIEQGDFDHVEDELGDVLFQVVFHAQMGSEQDLFDFNSVVNRLATKLIRRHPHVFAEGQIEGVVSGRTSIAAVKQSWEDIKQRERNAREQQGVLADIPRALPALPRSQKLQKRAARVGFDWSSAEPVFDKLREECTELEQALADGDAGGAREELGDILFTCVNLARHLGVDAEEALRGSSSRFEARFRAMEVAAAAGGRTIDALDDGEMDALWEQAKQAIAADAGDL